MKNNKLHMGQKAVIKYIYGITIFMLTLSGFGQMPVFKRYYIADIPGLGWLANFYVTHYLHYLFAVLLLAVISYILVDYLFTKGWETGVSISGYVRVAIITGLVITGVLMVMRNFSGYLFSPGIIVVMDISHLVLVMALLMSILFCIVFKKNWMQE